MPKRTKLYRGKGGAYRFDRTFGEMRITRSSGTDSLTEYKHRNQLLSDLWKDGKVELLKAFADGDLSIQELVEAKAEERLSRKAADLIGYRPLWQSWEDAIKTMRCSEPTKVGYLTAMQRLRRSGLLSETSKIVDLKDVDWHKLGEEWELSDASWMQMRRAVSRFLTVALADKFHPLRRQVMHRFPSRAVQPRLVDVTPQQVRRVIEMVPRQYRSIYMTLLLTGMRVGEYLQLTPEDLVPEIPAVRVKGQVGSSNGKSVKTEGSVRTIPVAPQNWHYIEQAVPAPIGYYYLREIWIAACDRAGVPRIRIHDLRHIHGQLAINKGANPTQVQHMMGHKTPHQTQIYIAQKARMDTANKISEAMAEIVDRNDEVHLLEPVATE